METGDRVKVKAKDGRWTYGTLGRTDRHRIEWLVKLDGEARAVLLTADQIVAVAVADVE